MKENRFVYPLVKMSKALGILVSGFYSWSQRPTSERRKRKIHLQAFIQKHYDLHGGMVGSKTLTMDLRDVEEICWIGTLYLEVQMLYG